MRKILILIILIIIFLILIIGWLAWKGYFLKKEKEKKDEILVTTFQKEYQLGENPKIRITNNSNKTICFSSCYPYYLERNNGSLKSYHYGPCPFADVAETCINSGQTKAFELLLDKMPVEKGFHRIAIPACIDCLFNENFRKDKFFYSNQFIIK